MHRAFEQATGGGAPQPAETTPDARRIALDGQAYTWPQFLEAYGDDAQRCWDDAYDRSIPRRIALDGQAYTWTQYVEAYGDDSRRCWDDAYDREVAAGIRSDASQLAVNAYGGPQPTTAIDEGTQHEDAIPVLALPSVCNFQEMQEMQPVQGMGGKAACAKQRELRQVCLQDEVFEIDVTETWPEWRAVLRALPQQMQQLIIGNGITQVKFRLLEGSRDANYAKKRFRGKACVRNSPGRHICRALALSQEWFSRRSCVGKSHCHAPECAQWRFSACCAIHWSCVFSVAAKHWSPGSRAGVDSPFERMLEQWGGCRRHHRWTRFRLEEVLGQYHGAPSDCCYGAQKGLCTENG